MRGEGFYVKKADAFSFCPDKKEQPFEGRDCFAKHRYDLQDTTILRPKENRKVHLMHRR